MCCYFLPFLFCNQIDQTLHLVDDKDKNILKIYFNGQAKRNVQPFLLTDSRAFHFVPVSVSHLHVMNSLSIHKAVFFCCRGDRDSLDKYMYFHFLCLSGLTDWSKWARECQTLKERILSLSSLSVSVCVCYTALS